MKANILQHELVTVMLRCITHYRIVAKQHEDKDFWKDIAPKETIENRALVREQTSHLSNFLKNGSLYYQVIHDDTCDTSFLDLNRAFANYCQFDLKIAPLSIGDDEFPIKHAGYISDEKWYCKVCNSRHNRKLCDNYDKMQNSNASHYNKKNKTRRRIIKHMRIIQKQKTY